MLDKSHSLILSNYSTPYKSYAIGFVLALLWCSICSYDIYRHDMNIDIGTKIEREYVATGIRIGPPKPNYIDKEVWYFNLDNGMPFLALAIIPFSIWFLVGHRFSVLPKPHWLLNRWLILAAIPFIGLWIFGAIYEEASGYDIEESIGHSLLFSFAPALIFSLPSYWYALRKLFAEIDSATKNHGKNRDNITFRPYVLEMFPNPFVKYIIRGNTAYIEKLLSGNVPSISLDGAAADIENKPLISTKRLIDMGDLRIHSNNKEMLWKNVYKVTKARDLILHPEKRRPSDKENVNAKADYSSPIQNVKENVKPENHTEKAMRIDPNHEGARKKLGMELLDEEEGLSTKDSFYDSSTRLNALITKWDLSPHFTYHELSSRLAVLLEESNADALQIHKEFLELKKLAA